MRDAIFTFAMFGISLVFIAHFILPHVDLINSITAVNSGEHDETSSEKMDPAVERDESTAALDSIKEVTESYKHSFDDLKDVLSQFDDYSIQNDLRREITVENIQYNDLLKVLDRITDEQYSDIAYEINSKLLDLNKTTITRTKNDFIKVMYELGSEDLYEFYTLFSALCDDAK